MSENSPVKPANRWWLYGPLLAGGVIVIAYAILWNYGAGIMRQELDKWVADQRAAGLTVEHKKIKVQGFPFVLRGRIDAPQMSDPTMGWHWQAERLYVDTLPYNPTRLILSPIGKQTLHIKTEHATEIWDLDSKIIRASLAENDIAFELHELLATPVLHNSAKQLDKVTIDEIRLNSHISDQPDTALEGDLGTLLVGARNIRLYYADPAEIIAIPSINLAFSLTGIAAINTKLTDQTSLDAIREAGGQLSIEKAEAIISVSDLKTPTIISANGQLHIDSQDYPAGIVTLSVQDPEAFIASLESLNLVPAAMSQQLSTGLKMIGSGGVPVVLKKGRILIGPIKVGKLQKLQ
ncbi:MAG: DUF2125 domain-containing protein [bacterium]